MDARTGDPLNEPKKESAALRSLLGRTNHCMDRCDGHLVEPLARRWLIVVAGRRERDRLAPIVRNIDVVVPILLNEIDGLSAGVVGHQNADCEEKSSVCLQDGCVRRLCSTNID